jgi:hypothetical protein
MKAVIHYKRINEPEVIYTESGASDDGIRLDTDTPISREISVEWAKKRWVPNGLLREGQIIARVRKHHFYQQWFGVMELRGVEGELMGFYCDLLTPLVKRGGEYYLQDLMLDLWIAPDRSHKELDWDEFEAAARLGQIAAAHQQAAVSTLRRMVDETRTGIFPWSYLPGMAAGHTAHKKP